MFETSIWLHANAQDFEEPEAYLFHLSWRRGLGEGEYSSYLVIQNHFRS